MNGDLILSGFDNLEKIVVKKNSLQNLNMLKICNNKQLKTIEIENGDLWNGAFLYVKNMVIQGTWWYYYLMFKSPQSTSF